jgi:alpha-glucosidase
VRLTEQRRPSQDLWWRSGVLYQIYPRSWVDADGDGIGDLRGIISRLDYLQWLGIDGVWLNPVTVSPDADWGYDVSDYKGVQPVLGTLADVDELVAEAASRGIRIVFDIVPNHTSDRHPWFLDARSSRTSRHRDWYVWADPKPDGSPPNNWLSVFGGSAWTLDEHTGQYYLHNFLPEQPDLNWWNDEVRVAFDDVLRFWFERGIAGFRIDVAHAIVKDRELRDNLPLGDDAPSELRRFGQQRTYSMNRPEVHDVLRRWRALCETFEPPRILIGETYVLDLAQMAAFYGSGEDELHLAFNFPFIHSAFESAALREVVAATEAVIPPAGWPAWTLSNHDIVRFPTRWCGGDPRKIRSALTALLALRGTPVLYYGDELGMEQVAVPPEDARDRDPGGIRDESRSRDGARTPMPWSAERGASFTSPGATPWLPLGDDRSSNVEAQRRDPGSVLSLCRDLIALRRGVSDLHRGDYRSLPAAGGVWAWERGESVVVAVNLSDEEGRLDGVRGVIRIGSERSRDGERVRGRLELGPWEAAIVARV